jgi:hypothetical protein
MHIETLASNLIPVRPVKKILREVFNQNLRKQLFPNTVQEHLFRTDLYLCMCSRDTSINVMTRPRGSIGMGRDLLSTASRPPLRPTKPPLQWVPRAPLPGLKLLSYEVDHVCEVNNAWKIFLRSSYVFMTRCLN